MKHRDLLALVTVAALTAAMSLTLAHADGHKANQAQDKKARAAEMRDERKKQAEARLDEAREGMPEAAEDATAAREDAEARMQSGGDAAASRGSATAQEMRERRDERKAIQEEYRSERPAGPDDDATGVQDSDADEDARDGRDNPKKPWWKFWGE